MSELNSEAKELLASARRADTSLSPLRRARLRRAVLAGVATWGTAAAASMSITKVVLACVVSAAIGSGVTLAVTKRPSQAPASTLSPVSSVPQATAPASVLAVEPPPAALLPAVKKAVIASPAETTPEVAVEPEVELEPAPRESAATSLQEELALIDETLTAVDAKQWSVAAAALDRYRLRFSSGAMEHEAASLEVLLRCGQDRVEEAKALARLLEQRAPMNPSVQRLQRSCAQRSP